MLIKKKKPLDRENVQKTENVQPEVPLLSSEFFCQLILFAINLTLHENL